MPCVICLTMPPLRFCMAATSKREAFDLDAVGRELVLRAMVELGGFEQRLGRDATGIEAGAAKGVAAVAILPFVDAGDRELVLGRADGGRIARRARRR